MERMNGSLENPEVALAIPAAVRPFCTHCGDLSFRAATVRALLAELARAEPQVHRRLCDERGDPRPHINVFVNDDHIRALAGLDTELTSGDAVTILPAVSGG